MKDERIVEALDARLPDDAAKARMWAAVAQAWNEIAEEEAAAKETGGEDIGQTAGEDAPPVILNEDTNTNPAEVQTPAGTFVVTRGAGAQASSKRRTRNSWRLSAVAAVLVVALGAGAIFFANGGMESLFPDDPTPVIPDDPTPGHSGGDDPDGDLTGIMAAELTWQGATYKCVSEDPVDAGFVGNSLGQTQISIDGKQTQVDVFAAKGKYATGSYVIVRVDSTDYLFLKNA